MQLRTAVTVCLVLAAACADAAAAIDATPADAGHEGATCDDGGACACGPGVAEAARIEGRA